MESKVAGDLKQNPSYSTLNELDLKGGSRRIVVRLLRAWEARNFKRNRELMSIDFLLLDEKECLIQGSIHHQRADQFRDSLIEGQVFLISNFDIVRSSNQYRLTDHQLLIRFTDYTTVVQVDEQKYSIQPEKFRLRCYDNLVELANKNKDLPDVIGYLCSVQKSEVSSEKMSKKIMLRILLEEGTKVRVTIWDDLVDDFCRKLDKIKDSSIVIVVTSINPKMFAGELYLNTTTSTKLYLNAGLDIVRDFRERIKTEHQFDETYKGFVSSGSDKQCKSISEILEFITNEEEQEKEFTCKAKITDIILRNGWSYISCSKCSRKLGRTQSTLICNNCENPQAVGVLRFRIEVVVEEGKDTATFVIFDRDAKKLMNRTASDLMTVEEAVAEKVGHEQTAPACIREIVGRTFMFQVKVTPYNFRSTYQTFTVSRIMDEIRDTEIKEEKQKYGLATEEESTGMSSTKLQELKSEVTCGDQDSRIPNIEKNKRRRLHPSKAKLEE